MTELNSPARHRPDMHQHLLQLMGQWQDAIQAFDEAVGNKLGLITAEHRCLKALMDGAKTAGQLAVASGLTPAAATSMIDRLEKRGFLERQRDASDRRKVLVAMTKPASDTLARFYKPVTTEGEAMLSRFSPEDLSIIEKFFESALTLQQAHVERTVNEPLTS